MVPQKGFNSAQRGGLYRATVQHWEVFEEDLAIPGVVCTEEDTRRALGGNNSRRGEAIIWDQMCVIIVARVDTEWSNVI